MFLFLFYILKTWDILVCHFFLCMDKVMRLFSCYISLPTVVCRISYMRLKQLQYWLSSIIQELPTVWFSQFKTPNADEHNKDWRQCTWKCCLYGLRRFIESWVKGETSLTFHWHTLIVSFLAKFPAISVQIPYHGA